MRPALKFLKHAPRGLKHLKHSHKHHNPMKDEHGIKKFSPLRFKSRA